MCKPDRCGYFRWARLSTARESVKRWMIASVNAGGAGGLKPERSAPRKFQFLNIFAGAKLLSPARVNAAVDTLDVNACYIVRAASSHHRLCSASQEMLSTIRPCSGFSDATSHSFRLR